MSKEQSLVERLREEWKDVAGYEGLYQVSDLGNVRVLVYRNGYGCKPLNPPKILRPGIRAGYQFVSLSKNRIRKNFLVHRLVLQTFTESLVDGLECAHLNGIRDDCRLENLAAVTKVENERHKKAHGSHPTGERVYNAKLSWEIVRKIRREHKWFGGQKTTNQFADEFDVNKCIIERVLNGTTWKE